MAPKTDVKGIYWDNTLNRWRVSVYLKGKRNYVGVYTDLAEAIENYNAFMRKNRQQKLMVQECNIKTGLPGIVWDKRSNSWVVRISSKGKRYYGGKYESFTEAVKVREELLDTYV